MIPVNEIFTSFQGEGKYMGIPSHFVRVSGCNLRCVFKDSICDTPYSSFDPEKSLYKNMDELVAAFKKQQEMYPHVKHLVITGGEPLLYKKELEVFLARVWDKEMVVTIETNGTMPILSPLPSKNQFRVDLYSVSPKLSTSVGKPGKIGNMNITEEMIKKHDSTRINIKNLVDIVAYSSDYQFKFVYSGPECIEEISHIYKLMADEVEVSQEVTHSLYLAKHPNKHTMLMPEGITNEQLAKSRKEIASICVEKGWAYTDRLHIIVYGDKRGV